MKKWVKKMMAAALSMVMVGMVTACGSATSNSSNPSSNQTVGGVQKVKDAGILKVGCKIDVPSFGIQNTGTGAYEGVEIDLAYKIAAEIFECTPEEAKERNLVSFQGVTAKTRGGLLDSGELDLVIATFTITEERKQSWNFSSPYYTDAVGLMVLAESGIASIQDLDGKVVGVAQGSSTQKGLEEYIVEKGFGITPIFEEFDGYPALSSALSTRNIDVFAVDRAILAGYNDDRTIILEDRFAEQDYGVASALANKELAELVEGVVTSLLNSGEMAQMLQGWGVE
jgi:putative glutamine transport system substrate-binding protein